MGKDKKVKAETAPEPYGIAEITVTGFKSISDEQSIEIRPLTILAGANSSGKSSMMQPLLLLKQTLEAPYDPGPLLLNGPNVKFTSADQLLSRIGKGHSLGSFQVGMRMNAGDGFALRFRKEHKVAFQIESMEISSERGTMTFWPEMSHDDIVKAGFPANKDLASESFPKGYSEPYLKPMQQRCFLAPAWVAKAPDDNSLIFEQTGLPWEWIIPQVIHVPGLRGNPERAYPVTGLGPTYPGTFERYTASVIGQWMEQGEEKLQALNADLKLLSLTGGITVFRPNEVQIEIHVARLPDVAPRLPEDRVNIADVGVGVSQVLPILVALHAATPRQLVYVEQPETHLHPRAQVALAQVLAAAANRGARVVVETHSSMLLLGIQTLVAEGRLDPNTVKLHWFEREKNGRTLVRSGELDEAGRFGQWPEDFDDVTLHAQKEYLDAADRRLFAQ
jgi:hypothetical protein